jgi:hypothetical protein
MLLLVSNVFFMSMAQTPSNYFLTFSIDFYNTSTLYDFGNNTCVGNSTNHITLDYNCACRLTHNCVNDFFTSDDFKNIEYNGIKVIDTCQLNVVNINNNKCISCSDYSIKYNYKQTGSCNIGTIIFTAILVGIGILLLICLSECCKKYYCNNNSYTRIN